MNAIERQAQKPLSAVLKRLGSSDSDSAESSALEILRLRIVETWSRKEADAPLPDWLDSPDAYRTHLQEIFGEIIAGPDYQVASQGSGALAAGLSAARATSLGDMFEAVLALAESPPSGSPFGPILLDIPFVAG